MQFEELYNIHKSKVYNLALQYVQNSEDAQEITQDVFVAVHQSISSFRHEAQVSTWIYRITINRSLDFIKAKNRKKRWAQISSIFSDHSDTLRHDPAHFDHPGIRLEQKEALHHLFKCLNALPENQRTALILTKIERKSQAEAAEIMKLSMKAVESLIQRAKNNLVKKLSANEG